MPNLIREARMIYGTTFNKTHTAANAAGWLPAAAHKLPISDIDLTKLVWKGIPSKVRRQRIYGAAAPILGLSRSELMLALPLGGGSATIVPPLQCLLMSHVIGGITNPPATKTLACEAACTTTNIKCTGHNLASGQAVLISGEARRINSVAINDFTLDMALSGAPGALTTIVVASTAWLHDGGTVYYHDLLALGLHAEDQIQTLGMMGPVTLRGLKSGEDPEMVINYIVPGWQEVPSAERASLTPTTAPEGDTGSTASQATGAFYMQDYGTTTRAVLESAEWEISPGVTFIPREDRSGLNGIGGFSRGMGVATAKVKVYTETDYGLHADFTAKTAKQVAFQLGNTAGACVLICLPRAYLTDKPVRTTLGDMAALELNFAGEATATTYNNSFSMHWF
jgi:hypothetical protein